MFLPTDVAVRNRPLRNYVATAYQVNFVTNWRQVQKRNIGSIDVSLEVDSITLSGVLVTALEPIGLAATHRFGTIWITTKEDAANWVDRTGVTTLLDHPPEDSTPQQRAAVKNFLNRQTRFRFVDTTVGDFARFVTQIHPANRAGLGGRRVLSAGE